MGDRQAFLERIEEIDTAADRLLHLMEGGKPWTKDVLAKLCRCSPHAVAARMSDLRKAGAVIVKTYEANGVYLYRMVSA